MLPKSHQRALVGFGKEDVRASRRHFCRLSINDPGMQNQRVAARGVTIMCGAIGTRERVRSLSTVRLYAPVGANRLLVTIELWYLICQVWLSVA